MILVCLKSVLVGTYIYKEKKMDPGFIVAKEQIRILCQMAIVKKTFTWSKLLFTFWGFVSLTVFSQISGSCVRVVYLEVMGIRPNVNWMA